MIKAVIFDLGGVFLDMNPLLDQTQKIFQVSDRIRLWEVINKESIPLCKGKITLLQFWKRVAKKLDRNIPDDAINKLWIRDYGKLTSVDKDVEDIAKELKKNYKLAVISNTIDEHVRENKRLGRFKLFDVVVLSNEVGLAKNEDGIFLLTEKRLGMRPDECIFIDDTEEFVEIAKRLGMKGIHYSGSRHLRSELQRLGILP